MATPSISLPCPDLLSKKPALRVDFDELRQALIFAFATGGAVESFDHAIGRARLPKTAWDRAYFERDLFLDQLVKNCLSIRINGRVHEPCSRYLLRALSEPPRDVGEVEFRRAILSELCESKTLRDQFESIYAELIRLRTLLCAGRFLTAQLRRLDILRALHSLIGLTANSFNDASSGLGRIREFGQAVLESPSYKRLDALLDHEEHLGTVDLRVRLGSDGELRTFQIVAVRENRDNPFHASPLGRWLAKLMLMLRGYRMNGGEVVERLFDDVFTGMESALVSLFQLLGDMEFYLSALGFRDAVQAKGLSLSFPEFIEIGDQSAAECQGMEILGLFNPLLLEGKTIPVPCDLRTQHADSVVLVTGPNSGGKTRLLQSLALCYVFGAAGLFVPASSARLPRFAGLFVSLLDETRADQPEGQLGMELLRIRRMFENLDRCSLVILDELCSGTNPSEGEEIARLVISLLPEMEAQAFVSTHLLQFAARLSEERPVPHLEFIQVELDPHERPTYGFVDGVAKTSLAHKTAARLGVTRDELSALIAKRKRAPK